MTSFSRHIKNVANIDLIDYKGNGNIQSHKIWCCMIRRCYDSDRRTYKDCTVCDDWLDYQKFAQWYDKNQHQNWHIDKDLLSNDVKIYSPSTCCFLPQVINQALAIYREDRDKSLTGVYHKNIYDKYGNIKYYEIHASCRIGKKRVHLGRFQTEELAHLAYVEYKKQYIRQLANQYKNELPYAVYSALINIVI